MRALTVSVILFCGLVLLFPNPVMAQNKPRAEIAGGYSFLHDSYIKENFPAAWFLSGSYDINDWLAAVGELGGSYKSTKVTVPSSAFLGGAADVKETTYSTTGRLHTLLFGPRYTRSLGRGGWFAQVLAGPAWESGGIQIFRESVGPTDHKLAIQPGAGFDFPLTKHINGQVAFDYRRIQADRRNATNKNNNEFRFGAGVAVPLGKR